MIMNSGRNIGLMVVAAVMMLAGCKDYDEFIDNGDPVRAELAYTFSSLAASKQTRQPDEVVVSNSSAPRLPDNLLIIPMIDDVPQNTDITWDARIEKKNTSDRTTSLYYYTQSCDFAPGVDECLVYGSVNDVTSTGGVDAKVYNGKINPSVNLSSVTDQSNLNLNTLTFDLEPIYKSDEYNETDNTGKDGIPTGASTIAGYLTEVANAHTDGGLYWKNSTNIILKNLFADFTNDGHDLPGSAATVKKWLEALATVSQDYISSPPSAVGENEIAILGAIKSAVESIVNDNDKLSTISDNSYPRDIKLPDGAAALRWIENVEEFVPQMETTTLDNINAMSRYAYPAALYYFVDSSIQTSNGLVSFPTEFNGITSEVTMTAWGQILEKFTDGGEVTSSTKAIALKAPVQYAIAQLQVSIKASASTLSDATTPTPQSISTTNNEAAPSFPLVGVIVCGQRPVDYKFDPVNSNADVKFIYDSQVISGCSLSTTLSNACNTLVLQSLDTGSDDDKDVKIILEFQNNSDNDFVGVDGTIYRGTRFYLIGKVDVSSPTSDGDTDTANDGRVFTKDYITTVNMTVTSLAKAYNVLPNLLSKNLEIGVMTTPEWIAATPTTVKLD